MEMVGYFPCVVFGLIIGFFGYWLTALVGWSLHELIDYIKNA